MFIRAMVIVLVAGTSACGRGPTTPTPTSRAYVGTWRGTLADATAGRGALGVEIDTQVDDAIDGSWSVDFAEPGVDDGGMVTGAAANASGATLHLQSRTRRTCDGLPPGRPVVTATLTRTGERMTGEYIVFGCGPLTYGTVELVRQRRTVTAR